MRTIIIGGGISGLSVAWFAHRSDVPVLVLEQADRVGGVITTDKDDGWLSERGPNSILWKQGREEDAFGRLIDQIGIESRTIEAGAAGAKRFVMRGGRLRALPAGPAAFLSNDLFSWRAKLRLLAEPLIGRSGDEETIAAFVTRRLGREFLDYAVEPFVSGVYAGDPAQLSVQAAVPRIYALEHRYGSLIRGAIAMGRIAKGAGMPRGRLVSFDDGMGVLPEGIAAALPLGSIRLGVRVESLARDGDGWRVRWSGPEGSDTVTAARVVLAVPAGTVAALLQPLAPAAADLLRTIAYAPIVSTAVGWSCERIGHLLDGFGFLVPRCEGVRILGGLFSSSLFPARAPKDHALITTFTGGATDHAAVNLDDAALLDVIETGLKQTLTTVGSPSLVRVTRWPKAIPQYTVGHLSRVSEIDRLTASLSGLYLRGSWREGVAVADCIRAGEILAQQMR